MMMQRVANAQQLWNAVLPDCPAPQPRQFVLWASRFSDAQLERAILRSSKRFAGGNGIAPEPVHRYVTGTLLNLEREQSATAEPKTAAKGNK
jgi:hypothetical protein